MSDAAPHGSSRPLRADARRNRERILAAAVDLFVEEGVDVPLDAIARRAGVGIGTLYRRFPDRAALVTAVAQQAFSSVRELADELRAGPRERLLERFVEEVVELRVGVLMTSLLPVITELEPDDSLEGALDDLTDAVDGLLEVARADGQLRADALVDDVLLLLAMLTRPLDGVPPAYAEAMTPRLLRVVLAGLRPGSDASSLPPAPPRPDPERARMVRAHLHEERRGSA